MRESIHKYFKIGLIHWMSFPPARYDVADSMRFIAGDDYFDAVEVCRFTDDALREKVREMLAQSHLKVCYGAQPRILAGLNPNAVDEAERLKAEAALIEEIDEAKLLGAGGIAFLAGKWQQETKDAAFAQLCKTLDTLCNYAKGKDMMIELEVFDYDMDKAALIGPAPYAAELSETVRKKHDNFGLIVDLSHFPTTYETSDFVVKTLKPYITHLHIGNAVVKKDCEAYGDMHPRFGFPGSANDTEQLLDFFRVLKAEGFFRPETPLTLSLEVKPWKDEDAYIILANTKRVINRAWAMLED